MLCDRRWFYGVNEKGQHRMFCAKKLIRRGKKRNKKVQRHMFLAHLAMPKGAYTVADPETSERGGQET